MDLEQKVEITYRTEGFINEDSPKFKEFFNDIIDYIINHYDPIAVDAYKKNPYYANEYVKCTHDYLDGITEISIDFKNLVEASYYDDELYAIDLPDIEKDIHKKVNELADKYFKDISFDLYDLQGHTYDELSQEFYSNVADEMEYRHECMMERD